MPAESLAKATEHQRKSFETAGKFARWLLCEMSGKVITTEAANAQAVYYLTLHAKGRKKGKYSLPCLEHTLN